jgi:ribosomal protein S18 acetylase RimI-like enzyme
VKGSILGVMLLERRLRPVRGVRIVSRDAASFGAQIVPLRRLEPAEVRRALDRVLSHEGPIVTSALTSIEQEPFRDIGFVELESLHLLRHDLRSPPRRDSDVRLRGARRTDIAHVLSIDRLSFDKFWRLDRAGLQAARRATPVHRFRVATIDRRVVGYAVTGFAGSTSYLQRLGVHPGSRGAGIGSHLVSDAIDWAIGRRSTSMLVNTQDSNANALRLYQHLGFSLDREKLRVLTWPR